MKQFALFILSLSFIIAVSCDPPKALPTTPVVKFKSLLIEDGIDGLDNEVKRVVLTIEVTDGDGDIGLQFNDGGLYHYDGLDSVNLFIELFQKVGGVFDTVKLLEPHHYATPYLEPEGQDKTLIADFETTFEYSHKQFTYDTIKYTFHIIDRNNTKSNTGESPEIPADTLGLIKAIN